MEVNGKYYGPAIGCGFKVPVVRGASSGYVPDGGYVFRGEYAKEVPPEGLSPFETLTPEAVDANIRVQPVPEMAPPEESEETKYAAQLMRSLKVPTIKELQEIFAQERAALVGQIKCERSRRVESEAKEKTARDRANALAGRYGQTPQKLDVGWGRDGIIARDARIALQEEQVIAARANAKTTAEAYVMLREVTKTYALEAQSLRDENERLSRPSDFDVWAYVDVLEKEVDRLRAEA